MRWSNVRLILQREVRDQLRDRRTLFMIFVLPLLLYPLMGMSLFQVAQFLREKSVKVLVIGTADLKDAPPLVSGNRFATELFSQPEQAELIELTVGGPREKSAEKKAADVEARARAAVLRGEFDVALSFPPDFAERLAQFRAAMVDRDRSSGKKPPEIPSPKILYNAAKETSQLGYRRVAEVVNRWTEEVGRRNLLDSQVPLTAAHPFSLKADDVAGADRSKAAVWAKVFPLLVLLWALTGAFYPAVDLCAGEKERGTLETLLSSPAERIEIVWGKLLTIMIFSMGTALLNLGSIAVTGSLVIQHLPNLPPPPLGATLWLLVALVPMSALFSALCLALAAFARSTKEGQYYLMPLVLLTMPLVILPMSPGVELNFGNSLIPVTGMFLLLRSLLEGEYVEVLTYLPVVSAVTLGCCWLAIRWATDQFNTESVLFRESERADVGLWLRHLVRDRQATPSAAEALACGVIILVLRFFLGLSMQQPESFEQFASLAVITQLVVVLTPALLMAVMLTRSPAQTLLLTRPSGHACMAIPVAAILAVAMAPVANALLIAVMKLYPIDARLLEKQADLIVSGNLWVVLGIIAVVPALCEELAFRGFILSGLRHLGHKRRAIIISALLFGISHAFFQQSVVATLLGVVIGYMAVQTGSLLPGIVFHFMHNALAVLVGQITPQLIDDYPALGWLVQVVDGGVIFRWPAVVVGGLVMLRIVLWLRQLPVAATAEESLQEAIERQREEPREEPRERLPEELPVGM
jgi:sodium transport system permease protein